MSIDLSKLSVGELKQLISLAQERIVETAEESKRKLREEFINRASALGFTLDEVVNAGRGGRRSGQAGRKGGTVGAAKYRNPYDPNQTWTGRGKRPNWFKDALAAGHSEESMKIR